MRRSLVLLGVFLLGAGLVMTYMLSQLRSDFFRAFLPPWVYGSYGLTAVGAIVVVVGLAVKPSLEPPVKAVGASGVFWKLAMLNTVAAALFVLPVLYPALRIPILITQWPGIYMVLAYFSFVLVGVLGMAAWALLLLHRQEFNGRSELGRLPLVLQIAMTELGVYGLAVSMFLGGYVGAWLSYTGAQPTVVGAQMEFSVIPSAVSIFLVASGSVTGVLNVLFSGRS